MSFLNKVALVTGGSSGIGAAVATKFLAEGAKVAIVGRNQAKLAAVAEKCGNTKPLVIVADVTNEDNVKTIIDDTVNKFGKLDVLVNNAGIGAGTADTSILSANALQAFDKVMATNLRSIVNLTNLAAPLLIGTKGNIINISSISSLRPYTSTGFAYNASKVGLDHFTRTIAAELATKGVRVNGINPGPVMTDIVKNSGANAAEEERFWSLLKKSTALGRISDAEEIAELVLYLAGDKARGITGASFVVDNGSCLKA